MSSVPELPANLTLRWLVSLGQVSYLTLYIRAIHTVKYPCGTMALLALLNGAGTEA